MFVRPRVLVVCLLAILVLGATFLLFSRDLTGRDYLKEFFLHQIEESIGRKIDVHRVKFVLFPSIRLELSQVVIHDRDPSQVLLTAKRIDLVLRLLPLLRKQVVGKRLLIEEPHIELRRDRNGQWNILGTSMDQSAQDQQTIQMMGQVFLVREATIVKGDVLIEDDSRVGGIRTVRLHSVGSSLTIRPDRTQADLRLSATMDGESGQSALSLSGLVAKASPPEALETEDSRERPPLVQFEGTIEVANVQLRSVADFFGPRPIPEGIKGAANLRSYVRVLPGVAGYDMVLTDVNASVERLRLAGNASLSGLLTAQPTFSISVSSSEADLTELLMYVPGEWVHPKLMTLVAEHQISGIVQAVNVTMTGSAMPDPRFSVTGEFRVQKGQALVGDNRTKAKDLAAKVLVETGRVRITNLSGIYGAIQISDGKAMVSFLEAGPWLEMEISGSMAAADLALLLARTIQSPRLTKFFADSRDVQGTAMPTFRLVGPLNQKGGVTFVGGEIVARHISLSNPLLSDRLTGLQGRFILSEGGAQFDQVTGNLSDSEFQLHGTITAGNESAFQAFQVRAKGDAAHFMKLLPAGSIPNGMFQGVVGAAMVFSGPTATPHVRGDLVFTEAKWNLHDLGEKPTGIPATLQFEGNLSKTSELSVTQLDLLMPGIHLATKGKVQFGQRFGIDASIATGTVSLSALPEWMNKGGLEAGNFEVSLDIKGTERDWKTWRINGWVALTNGFMLARGLDGNVQDLYVRMKLARNAADVKRIAFRIKDSDVSMTGTIKNWASKPTITAKIESSHMDIDLLIPKGERSPVREFLETLAATSRVNATATIDRGVYKQLRLGNLSCRITIENGVLDVDRINAQSETGQLAGRAVIQLPKKAPADAEVSLRLAGMPFEEFLPLLGTSEQWVTGELRATGTVRGHGRNPHGVLPTLSGKMTVQIQNGRALKSQKRAIWKVLTILNLPAVLQGKVDFDKEGLMFNKLTATLTSRNGVVESEDVIMDSPVLKITAAGNYDLATDQLDMVWAVSPFGSYSQFLKTIPLFGRLFAGERKGIATALFSVKGSLEDPEVTYLPMKSFATGMSGLAQLAFDVLKNTITLPIDLMSPDLEKVPSESLPLPESSAPSSP
ncbi:MAG: YhdP family protein [Nitrospiraceae bacterium]